MKLAFGLGAGGACCIEEELRTEELDVVPELDLDEEDVPDAEDVPDTEDEPDALDEDDAFCVPELLERTVELDAPCEEEPSSPLLCEEEPPLPETEDELLSPGWLPDTRGEEEEREGEGSSVEEDDTFDPSGGTGGSTFSSP